MSATGPEGSRRLEAVLGFAPARADAIAAAVAALVHAAVGAAMLSGPFWSLARGAADGLARKTSLVRAGLSLFWDPTTALGVPLLAEPASAALYPLNFVFHLAPGRPAFAVFALIHLVLFSAGAYLLLRGFRAGAVASLLAAIGTGLGLFGVGAMAGFGVFTALAWFPLLAWSLQRRMAGGDETATAAAGIGFGLSLLAGSPAAAAVGAAAAALVVLALARRGPEPSEPSRLSRPLLAALALGLLIGAGQVVPAALSARPDPEAYPVLLRNERWAELFGLTGSRKALPRAFSIPDARWAAGREEALRMIAAPDFDGRAFVALEGRPPARNQPRMGNTFEHATIVVDAADHVEVVVDTKHPGWLVLLDGWAPGWRARVNGRPAEIYRADGFFRAVAVGTETTRVEFYYRPPEAVAGLAASLVGTGLAGFFLFRRRPRWLWWALWAVILVLTPMVEGGTTYLPVTVLRLTVLAMAALWALTLDPGRPVFHRTRIDLFVLAFWLLTAASTAASVYLYISLYWYLNITAFVMLFFLTVQFCAADERAGRGLFGLAVLAGAVQAAWAVAEAGDPMRASAGYFNPAYLAGSLMMVSPYLLARALDEWGQSRARAAGWAALFLLFGAGIVASESRAVVVWPAALLVAGWPGVTARLESGGRSPARARRLAAAVLAGVVVLAALSLALVPNPLRERLRHLDRDEFAFERVHIWGVAQNIVWDHPLGVGPGMFRFYSPRYRFPVPVTAGRYERVAENAHSEYLGWAAEMSPLAPLLLLLPAAGLGWAAARAGARRKDPLLSGAAGGMTAAGLHALFDANLHDHALATLAVLMAGAAVAGLARQDGRWGRPLELRPGAGRLLSAGLVGLLAVGTAGNFIIARSYRLALLADEERDAGRAAVRLTEAARRSLGNAQPWRQLATLFFSVHQSEPNVLLLEKAEKAALTARRLNPADPEVYRLLGEINLELYRVSGADDPHRAAEKYFSEARARDPANLQLFTAMARLRRLEGDKPGEVEWLRRALVLEPYDLTVRVELVQVLALMGRTDDARRELSELIARWKEVQQIRRDRPREIRRQYQLDRVAVEAGQIEELKALVGGLKPGRGAR